MKLNILSVAFPFAPVRPDTAGGAEQVLLALDRAIVRAGHRSIVVACEGSRCSGILVETPSMSGTIDDTRRRKGHAEHREAIMRALRVWNVDVVHLHGLDFDAYRPPPEIPALVTLHLPLSWYPDSSFSSRFPRTFFTCVSSSQRNACPSLPNLLPTIENGVETNRLAGARGRGGYALAVGRICPEKGFHLALDAAERAKVPLRIAGQVFPYESHIRYFEEEIRPRLDDRRVHFLGTVGFERKRRLLLHARCLLAPSCVPETSSLVAMESLAAGTPVVAFPSGALVDIVEHGKTGFLVRDTGEMAEAIHACGSLKPEDCREAARNRFSVERMVGSYFDAYERIIDRCGSIRTGDGRDGRILA